MAHHFQSACFINQVIFYICIKVGALVKDSSRSICIPSYSYLLGCSETRALQEKLALQQGEHTTPDRTSFFPCRQLTTELLHLHIYKLLDLTLVTSIIHILRRLTALHMNSTLLVITIVTELTSVVQTPTFTCSNVPLPFSLSPCDHFQVHLVPYPPVPSTNPIPSIHTYTSAFTSPLQRPSHPSPGSSSPFLLKVTFFSLLINLCFGSFLQWAPQALPPPLTPSFHLLYFLFIPSIPPSHQSSSPHPQYKLRITSCLRASLLSFCLVIHTCDLYVYWVHLHDRNSIFMFSGFNNESNVRPL